MSLATPDLHPPVPATSSLAAAVTMAGSVGGTITATDNQGTCKITIGNNSTVRGPIFETVGLDLTDAAWKVGSGASRSIRFENRGAGSGGIFGTNEWHIGGSNLDSPTICITDTQFSHRSTLLGFYSATPVTKATVTGSKGANAALTSLMSALSALGLVTDSTT